MANDFFILMRSELFISAIIFLLLILKLGTAIRNSSLLVLLYILLPLLVVVVMLGNKEGILFGGLYQVNSMIVFQKAILAFGTLLIAMLNHHWLKRSEHLAEFFILMLSALLGMFFMLSSGNLLIFYLSLELSTIPVAALANFDLEKRISSEAAMKMILSSAFSSGLLLFGISLIYGASGTIQFAALPHLLHSGSMLGLLGFILFLTAFAFKLSVVPFHLWTADVYEGAPVAVSAFLSVISKGAVAFVLMRMLFMVFTPLRQVSYNILMVLILLTLLVGNIFALRQNNLKRFLAFSSIAQVGFILVGVSAGPQTGSPAVIYFILIYAFSNLAAFGVVSAVSSSTGKETIDDFRGFYANNKMLSWMLALSLFSLAGIPPTAGFFGKFFLILAGATLGKVWFISIVALNLVLSLYYYLRVLRAVFMDSNPQPLGRVKNSRIANFALGLCAAGILVTGLWGWIYEYINSLV